MKVESLAPMLRTWALPGKIEFYCREFGFKCQKYDEQSGRAILTWSPVSVMFSGPNDHEGDAAPAFTGSIRHNKTA